MGAAVPHGVLPEDHACLGPGDASFALGSAGLPPSGSRARSAALGGCGAAAGPAAFETLWLLRPSRAVRASSFLGLPLGALRAPRGPPKPLLLIRGADPQGLCFDGDSSGIRFDDNEEAQPEDGERNFIIDGSPADRKREGDRLLYRLSKNLDAKDFREGRYLGAPWGGYVTGKETGDGWVQVGERFLPLQLPGGPLLIRNGASVLNKSTVIWEDTPSCGPGNSRIIYAGGKSPVTGMNNQPEAERLMEQLHTYHAQVNGRLAKSESFQEAAASGRCAPTPAGQKGASGPVVTWQVANMGVGGRCSVEA